MSRTAIHRGSGNVYKDLGFPNAEEMQAKAALVSGLYPLLNRKNGPRKKLPWF